MDPRRLAVLVAVLVCAGSCGEAEHGQRDSAALGDDATATDAGDTATVASEVDVVVARADADCDGVADDEEAAHGTRADDADSDGDGLPDGLELGRTEPVAGTDCPGFVPDADPHTKTDPTKVDSDGDGIPDGVEDLDHDGQRDAGETAANASDSDCDGLDDAVELATRYPGDRRTDPNDADSDDDGIADGVERGVLTPAVTTTCALVPRDGDTASTTDPTSADSDHDGLPDGCEDANHNGVVDFGETDPQAFDTDGDQRGDGVEDADHDCVRDPGETDPTLADSDGDGISDGVERALGTTDPNARDSDQDGLPDGVEDRDQDGVVDADETDPRLSDSDGDGLGDGEEDLDHDGLVGEEESDPRAADSDGDGLDDGIDPLPFSADGDQDGIRDRLEDVDGDGLVDDDETDPTLGDSDGDGVLDGVELMAGTDPLAGDEPVADAAAGIAETCRLDADGGITLHVDGAGDWTLALPEDLAYAPAAVTGGHAATFDDDELAGFVLERAPVVGGVTAQAEALIAALGALGGAVTTTFGGRETTSDDGFATLVEVQLAVTLTSAADPSSLRNRVLALVADQAEASIGGLPGPDGAQATSYVVRLAAQLREGPRLVVLGGVTSRDAYVDGVRIALDDLATASGLARAHADTVGACTSLTVTGEAKVDFIWMADVSGSTDNDRGRIVSAAGSIFSRLAESGVDFRMGVVPSSENRLVDSTPGQLRSGFVRDQAQFEADLEDTSAPFSADVGCEYGLTAMDDAIVRALPRTAVESPTRLREDARLVAFYISDETAQEIESAFSCEAPRFATGQNDNARNLPPNGLQQHYIQGIVAPFVARIRGQGGVAFGQVLPVKAPFCNEPESGLGYVDVIQALGGSFYRTCDADPGFVLDDMLDTIAAEASDLVLGQRGISATLTVGVTRSGTTSTTIVPRSASDGFVYQARTNAIFFRGDSYRPRLGDKVTVSFRRFTAPRAATVCEAPLVPDARGERCVCAATPGSGACGGDTCGAHEVCDGDGESCGCRCAADCGGGVGRNFVCASEPVCGPVCGDADDDGVRDCNMRCATNLSCDAACTCACVDREPGGEHDCNGLVTTGSHLVCDVASCLARCPLDCGGCREGERCDLATCGCVR
ncbi:MAG: hypothetical protein U1F43_07755 [Myxococcota bacterium]